MLARKITKEQYDALPDVIKAEYKGDGAGYVLDVDEQSEDTAALKSALERTKQEKKQLADDLNAIKEREKEALRLAEEKKRQGIIEGGDIAAIKAQFETEREELRQNHTATISKKDAALAKLLVSDKAQSLAVKLAGEHAPLILPHIRARLSADLSGDEPRTVVTTENGGPSTLSLEELEKEFLARKEFSPILLGVDSSGGNASRKTGGDASKKPKDYTEAERIELYRTNRAEFDRLFPQSI